METARKLEIIREVLRLFAEASERGLSLMECGKEIHRTMHTRHRTNADAKQVTALTAAAVRLLVKTIEIED